MTSFDENQDLIAISGCGSISPLGVQRDAIYLNYLSDETCLAEKYFNEKIYPVGSLPRHAEEELGKLVSENTKYRKVDKTILMAIKAATLAFEEAQWKPVADKITGVNLGSSRGSTALFEQLHEEFLNDKAKKTSVYTSPLTTLGFVSNLVASHLDISGPVINTSVTCSTGIQAISNAIAWIKAGMADRFLAGGTEAALTSFTLAQVEALGIYSKLQNTKYPCVPLSSEHKNLNTFVLGEGAAIFAIEKKNVRDLKERKPLGIIESIGFSFEKPPNLTGLSENGSLLTASMKMAMKNMITRNDIDLVLLHSPGTAKGDNAELNAVKEVFRNNIPNLYTNKWKIGHTYSAAPALSLELAIICLQNNFLPAFPYKTIVNNSVKDIRKIMINATGFGGNATSIIISHPDIIV
jgi:3-oxoacyl-[acyl-carrier-protein] synthase II